ncbi:hypothetical protein K503DRAFT_870269 [Rhizopogon vinicolor AM-OR11-026]|uniref:Carbonic anhydrase n=1 Tax=Rhizopogon vinicolor AM-OR11-026 TaxID=1314800 RepID=A0A1B7MHY7_9AGAM|nr:hypothetical protein K503DRAFT_870269 [Rhizopogon vinicolor AM-OR11-026]
MSPRFAEALLDDNKHWTEGPGTQVCFAAPDRTNSSPSGIFKHLNTHSVYAGDIFTRRNIVNLFRDDDDDNGASVLTSVVEPPDVGHVVLVGRTNCGAAQECLRLATNPELPNTPLIRWLSPFIKLVQSLHLWAF